jgi:hypothetical protein
MTVQNAQRFIRRASGDRELRGRLNGASSMSEVHEILEDEGLGFSSDQFIEAYLNLLKECQTQEEADHVKEFRSWWEFLSSALGN